MEWQENVEYRLQLQTRQEKMPYRIPDLLKPGRRRNMSKTEKQARASLKNLLFANLYLRTIPEQTGPWIKSEIWGKIILTTDNEALKKQTEQSFKIKAF